MLTPTRLKAVSGLDEAVELFKELGFVGTPVPVHTDELGLGDLPENRVLKSASGSAKGSAVFFAELPDRPRSFKPIGKRLLEALHDEPLAVFGIRGKGGGWSRFMVVRPKWVPGAIGAVRVARLEVDLASPTRHDAEVLSSLAWSGTDKAAQERIDRSLDAEAVTKRFYIGLAKHHEAITSAVGEAVEHDTAILNGVKVAGGVDRVALRILTQILFSWFLQRMHLLAGDADYLRTRFIRKAGNYYQTELETLFYDTLSRPVGERPAGAPGPEIPFLNGGLFVRHYGDVSLSLPDALFDTDEGLIGFLAGWTFTVAEDVPDEVEVAVDPEMLGKVFENLISDEEARKQGTVYTPRPVVHFMCREALVPWLQDTLKIDEEWSRRLLVQDDALAEYANAHGAEKALGLAETLDLKIRQVHVLDPAVGSGAFLLGMLAEIVRLRRMVLEALSRREPTPNEIVEYKLHAIEQSLFGVDINPTAIELCRLRLWLSLVVEQPPGTAPHPLPNLEYRTIVANSLTDFVNGIEVQNTREGQAGGLDQAGFTTDKVRDLRHAYFVVADPEAKAVIRAELEEHEDALIEQLLERARSQGEQSAESTDQLEELLHRFRSWDREFPVFFPDFHAPDVRPDHGWDIVIMNPPYLGKKEVAQHIDAMRLSDYKRHFGDSNDLMILFAQRAQELARPGGIVSMIFNDSIFTSTDAEDLRRAMFAGSRVLVCARTKCFEGRAINGGVVVRQLKVPSDDVALRWVEGYKRPTVDFAAASDPLPFAGEAGRWVAAGEMEVFSAPSRDYRVLPHRPLFRPSVEALALLSRFTLVERWESIGTTDGWGRLSNTPALESEVGDLRTTGWYERLVPGQWVLLGYVIEGGQGLATADDKHFLGAIDGTEAAESHLQNQERLENLLRSQEQLWARYEDLRRSADRESALLALWDDLSNDSVLSHLWPKGATFRVATKAHVRREPLSDEERENGIESGPFWVPFEKGDQSQEVVGDDGRASFMGARWTRENPLVIDWSRESVALLRARARGSATRRKPYFRNEDLWFTEGATWNRVTSYLRCRFLGPASIFSDKTPLITSIVPWLSPLSLMAILNADVVDFIVRTLLGSRMQIEIGDVRHLSVPVLSEKQNRELSQLAERALEEKSKADTGGASGLADVEHDINEYVRDLYGVTSDAQFWVVR